MPDGEGQPATIEEWIAELRVRTHDLKNTERGLANLYDGLAKRFELLKEGLDAVNLLLDAQARSQEIAKGVAAELERLNAGERREQINREHRRERRLIFWAKLGGGVLIGLQLLSFLLMHVH